MRVGTLDGDSARERESVWVKQIYWVQGGESVCSKERVGVFKGERLCWKMYNVGFCNQTLDRIRKNNRSFIFKLESNPFESTILSFSDKKKLERKLWSLRSNQSSCATLLCYCSGRHPSLHKLHFEKLSGAGINCCVLGRRQLWPLTSSTMTY